MNKYQVKTKKIVYITNKYFILITFFKNSLYMLFTYQWYNIKKGSLPKKGALPEK